MSTDGKVLRFPDIKRKDSLAGEGLKGELIDIGPQRQKTIEEERREVRRTLLTEFIGVHVLVPGYGLQKCSLHDISVKGLAFDLIKKQGHFSAGEERPMRVYLNHKTYFSFVVYIRSSRYIKEEGVYRHGTSFVKGTVNHEALKHFVGFLESVSASLRTDHGDVMVSNLNQF